MEDIFKVSFKETKNSRGSHAGRSQFLQTLCFRCAIFILILFLAGFLSSCNEEDSDNILKKSEQSNKTQVEKTSKPNLEISSAEEQKLRQLIDTLKLPAVERQKKWDAVQELRKLGKNATPALINILKETDKRESHYYAIRTLGYIKDFKATSVLCDKLLDRNYGPRRYAAIALGQIGDPQSVEGLKKALSDVAYVRDDALDALVKIDNEESHNVLEEYHFGNSSKDFRLEIKCDKQVYTIDDNIQINAVLTNTSEETIRLGFSESRHYGHLVFQHKDGTFIEKIDTVLKTDSKVSNLTELYELPSGKDFTYSFVGLVTMWTRGEKDDHAFIPSKSPFLTLDFESVAFHIRNAGEYTATVVFLQDEELIERLKAAGVQEEKLQQVWQGKAVSNVIEFEVTE